MKALYCCEISRLPWKTKTIWAAFSSPNKLCYVGLAVKNSSSYIGKLIISNIISGCLTPAFKCCFGDQNCPEIWGFLSEKSKIFWGKSPTGKFFFWPPQSKNPTCLPVVVSCVTAAQSLLSNSKLEYHFLMRNKKTRNWRLKN